MAKKANTSERLFETAMTLAAERSWRDLSLAEIAESAGLSLGEAYAVFRSKSAILRAFSTASSMVPTM